MYENEPVIVAAQLGPGGEGFQSPGHSFDPCEAFLIYESSCGPNGLVSILLLAVVSRRQGAVADDLQVAADHAEILLGIKICKHQHDTLDAVHEYLTHGGAIWS